MTVSQYLLSGNEDNIEEIKAISENFNLDIEEINTTVDEFRSKRDSLYIAYYGKDSSYMCYAMYISFYSFL